MKKCLIAFLVVALSVLYLANFVPGTTKYSYGGYVTVLPIPDVFIYGVGGYYYEGLSLYYYEPQKLHIDGFFGPSLVYAGGNIAGVQANDVGLLLNGAAVIYSDNFSFELFGMKMYPAVELNPYIGYYVIGVNPNNTGSKLTYSLLNPKIVVYTKPAEKGKISFSGYFWPFPITIGFSVWSF